MIWKSLRLASATALLILCAGGTAAQERAAAVAPELGRLFFSAAERVAYTGLLAWVHYWVIRAAIRDPVRMWWVWALVAFGLWMHRRQIQSMRLLPP